MEFLSKAWELIVANPALMAAIMALGGAIVKITPTKTDDAWFQKIVGFIGKLLPKKA